MFLSFASFTLSSFLFSLGVLQELILNINDISLLFFPLSLNSSLSAVFH